MPATKKKKIRKKKIRTVVSTPPPKFKNRGGTKFTLSLNGNKQHDIILEECNLGGTQKVKGETKPRDLIDTFRAVMFFMWGTPLDEPIDKETLASFKKALKRMKKEDPDLFK